MDKILIKDLKIGNTVTTYFSVKYKHEIAKYKKGYMFVVGVSDRSGEIEVTYWGGGMKDKVNEAYNLFAVTDVISVSGVVSSYKDKVKIDVNEGTGSIRKCLPGEYDLSEFIPRTNQDTSEIVKYLKSIGESFKNSYLKALLNSFFEDENFIKEFKKSPAAMYHHHACTGGLAEHTWGVVKICESVSEIHPSLDRELMLTGAILHDIGKIYEFEVTTNIRVSEEGMLRGHISLAEEMIIKKIDAIDGFPKHLRDKIIHIIISHHGKKENGSPQEPQFAEAAAVYLSDLLDSQITQYIRAKKDNSTEDFRIYIKSLNRQIYLR